MHNTDIMPAYVTVACCLTCTYVCGQVHMLNDCCIKINPTSDRDQGADFVRHYCQSSAEDRDSDLCVCGILSGNSLNLAGAEVLCAILIMQWWSAAGLHLSSPSLNLEYCF